MHQNISIGKLQRKCEDQKRKKKKKHVDSKMKLAADASIYLLSSLYRQSMHGSTVIPRILSDQKGRKKKAEFMLSTEIFPV